MAWISLSKWYDVELRILASRSGLNFNYVKDITILTTNLLWKMFGSDRFYLLEKSDLIKELSVTTRMKTRELLGMIATFMGV